jgi:hypothetical protein
MGGESGYLQHDRPVTFRQKTQKSPIYMILSSLMTVFALVRSLVLKDLGISQGVSVQLVNLIESMGYMAVK